MLPFLFIPHEFRCRCGSRRRRRLLLFLFFCFSFYICFFFLSVVFRAHKRGVFYFRWFWYRILYIYIGLEPAHRKYTRHEKLYAEDETRSSGEIARRHLTSVVGGWKSRKIGVSFASTLCRSPSMYGVEMVLIFGGKMPVNDKIPFPLL